jgi:SRSO17 transposase
LIDRRLYLPRSWSEDQSKRNKAAIPESIQFATKPQLAQQMLQSAFKAGIRPAWFVADEVYGTDGSFWWWLEQTGEQSYVLTVNNGTLKLSKPKYSQSSLCGQQIHRYAY